MPSPDNFLNLEFFVHCGLGSYHCVVEHSLNLIFLPQEGRFLPVVELRTQASFSRMLILTDSTSLTALNTAICWLQLGPFLVPPALLMKSILCVEPLCSKHYVHRVQKAGIGGYPLNMKIKNCLRQRSWKLPGGSWGHRQNQNIELTKTGKKRERDFLTKEADKNIF